MSTVGEMLVALGINTGPFTAGMAKANAELRGFAAEADATGKKASSSFSGVGLAAAGIAGGVAVIGASAVKSASAFQASMTLIQTQAGASASEVRDMSAAVLALAPAVGVGPEQLSAGLYHIESAGMRGAKALDLLKIAAEGAKVGNADLESVTNALIASVQSGVGGVTTMSGAMGTLNAIVGSGNMRMQDLADAMGTGVLSTAKVYGVTIQSVGAALASMTDQGIPAIDAATRLNSAMRLMAAPTAAAQKDLASIGLSSTKLASDMRSPGGMLAAITDLKKHLEGAGLSATAQAALIANAFGGKQSGAILTLIGNVGLLGQKTADVAKGAGAFGAAWAATEQTTAEQGAQVDASMKSIEDSIGTGLLPAVNSLLHAVLPVVQGLASWAAANPDLASKVLLAAGAVAALVAGVVFLGPILGAVGAVIGAVASPIVLVIGAIAGLAAHFGLLGKGPKDAVDGIASTIAGAVPGIIAKVQDMAQAFIAWVGPMIPVVVARLQQLAAQVGQWIAAQAPAWLAQAGQWAQAFTGWISPMIPKAIGMLGDLASQVIGWVAAQAPGLVAQLLAWADAFISWVAPMIPKLLGPLGDFGKQLIQWVLNELPVLGAALFDMGKKLIEWIGPKIPDLLLALGQFGIALLGWIAGEVPVLATALWTFAASLSDWVKAAIPGLLKNLGDFISSFMDWANTQEVAFYKAALAWGGQIVQAVMDAIGGLPGKVGGLLGQIPGFSLVAGAVGGAVGAAGSAINMLPHLGTGGLVTAPTLAVIGESGPEMVIPLAGLHREGAKGVTGAAAPSAASAAVSSLAAHVRLEAATNAVASARAALARIEREHVTKSRTAADIAAQAAAAERRLSLAVDRLALLREQQALGTTGTSGASGSGASPAASSAPLAAALAAFTAALLRAVSAGVPVTLDGQEIGNLIDQHAYGTASRATSGFIASGGPVS